LSFDVVSSIVTALHHHQHVMAATCVLLLLQQQQPPLDFMPCIHCRHASCCKQRLLHACALHLWGCMRVCCESFLKHGGSGAPRARMKGLLVLSATALGAWQQGMLAIAQLMPAALHG
jgi:hypothetical protein